MSLNNCYLNLLNKVFQKIFFADDFDDSEFPEENNDMPVISKDSVSIDSVSITSSIDRQKIFVTPALAIYTFQVLICACLN